MLDRWILSSNYFYRKLRVFQAPTLKLYQLFACGNKNVEFIASFVKKTALVKEKQLKWNSKSISDFSIRISLMEIYANEE